jgi:hypothetical protein
MNTKQLASKILQHRGSSSLIIPGNLVAEIGNEGLKEALDRRWVEPDQETGYLRMSLQQSVIEQMREIAEGKCDTCKCDPCECCEKCCKHPCCCQEEGLGARQFMDTHTHRHQYETFVAPPAYGSGQPAQAPAARVEPTTNTNRSPEPMVGEDVIIADEGKSYQAKIASKNQDGTFKLSFGPQRPAKERMFRKEEIQRVKPGDVQLVK